MGTIRTCGRCHGAGSIRGFEHIWDGRCFKCLGLGTVDVEEQRERSAMDRAVRRIPTNADVAKAIVRAGVDEVTAGSLARAWTTVEINRVYGEEPAAVRVVPAGLAQRILDGDATAVDEVHATVAAHRAARKAGAR
jgi:hypothetical protein